MFIDSSLNFLIRTLSLEEVVLYAQCSAGGEALYIISVSCRPVTTLSLSRNLK